MTTLDEAAVIRGFEDQTWPLEQWTHRAHLTVAYHYLRTLPFDEAKTRMRSGIQTYNAAHEIPEAIDRGYHETLTMGWMHILRAIMDAYGEKETAAAFLEEHPYFQCRTLLRLFYSRSRIMTEQAKREFVEPDLASLSCAQNSTPEA